MGYYQRKDEDLMQFLNRVHQDMMEKYAKDIIENNIEKEKREAYELQDFLNNIKKGYMEGFIGKSDEINTVNLVIEDLKQLHPQIRKGFLQQTSGKSLELQLSEIMASVALQAVADLTGEGRKAELKKYAEMSNVGKQKTTIDFSKWLHHNFIQNLLQDCGVKTRKKIKESNNKDLYYYLQDVEGKIDNTGLKLNIPLNFQGRPYLQKMYNLLSQATISAKNYSDYFFTGPSMGLRLGGTNLIRILYSIFVDLGNSKSAAIKRIYQIKHHIEESKVSKEISKIQFVYELIGPGLIYAKKEYEFLNNRTVKFFIWNNPQGDIYVRSTKDMIKELLDNDTLFNNNIYYSGKDMYISKNFFDSEWKPKEI